MSTRPPDATIVNLQRAGALCTLRRFDEAVTLLERVVASDAQDARGWCLMAQAKLGQRDPSAALRAARRAVAVDPELEWPHRLASIALNRLGLDEEAVQAAREAVRRDPNGASGHVRLAQALTLVKSRLDEAASVARRALKLAPHDPDVHVVAGAVAAAAGRREDAAAAFRRALALDPQNTAAQNELARLHLRKRDPRGLASAARGFADVMRTSPHAHVSRRNLDVVMRTFLTWVAYFVLLDVLWVAGSGARSGHLASRMAPIALLAVPAVFAWRFTARVSGDLRAYLLRLPFVAGRIRLAAGLEALAITGLIGAALASQPARRELVGVACLATLVAYYVLRSEARRAARGDQPGPPLGTRGLWLLAGSLALGAVLSLSDAFSTSARVVGIVWAIGFASGCAITIRAIARRRSLQQAVRAEASVYSDGRYRHH
jgi:cytochrome c-type biogenesis protein CcmH/NrfG